jgi:hypothetical protein
LIKEAVSKVLCAPFFKPLRTFVVSVVQSTMPDGRQAQRVQKGKSKFAAANTKLKLTVYALLRQALVLLPLNRI